MSKSRINHKDKVTAKPARHDVLTQKQRRFCMSRIRGKDTSAELAVRKALWHLGFRYRCHTSLPGRPDIVFPGRRVAIFIDGCFWHGCPMHSTTPKTRRQFWVTKISANVERDHRVTRDLQRDGWTVLRIWEHDIRDNLATTISTIVARLQP